VRIRDLARLVEPFRQPADAGGIRVAALRLGVAREAPEAHLVGGVVPLPGRTGTGHAIPGVGMARARAGPETVDVRRGAILASSGVVRLAEIGRASCRGSERTRRSAD